jgi:hypothetical protein
MRPLCSQPSPTTAILTLAEIKAAIEAFDRGDANVCDALGAIILVVEDYQAAARPEPHRDAA